jgi:hypothetical protein
MIKRLYFDTNSLEGRWPFYVSGRPAIATQLARRLGVEVCVPNSVVVEHVNSTVRHVAGHLQEAKKQIAKAQFVLNRFTDLLILTPLDEAEFRRAHAAAVKQASDEHGLTIIATSERSVEDYVAMAASFDPPFKDQDLGFRDAVHLQSVLAHLKDSPPAGDAVLVTHDGRLLEADVVAFAKRPTGIDITVQDLNGVIRLMRQSLTTPDREELAQLASSLADELRTNVVSNLLPTLRKTSRTLNW